MASNDDNAHGEGNSKTDGIKKEGGKLQIVSGNQARALNIVGTSGATTSTAAPIQILTPEMLASLSAQGLIIQRDGDNVIQAVKRVMPSSSSSSSEQTFTKVVITRAPGKNPVSAQSSVRAAPATNSAAKFQPDGKTLLSSGSPIKVITVSQGSTLPKGVMLTSPSKQSSKFALATTKSPGKTITLAGSTTPKKIAPASNQGGVGQTILMKGSVGNTPGTITLSSGAVAKVINVINTSGASTTGVAAGSAVPVQIHAAGQHQQQLAPGMAAIRPAASLANQTNLQAVNMAGTKFPYVRLVTVSTNTTTSVTQGKPILQMANTKPIAPAPTLASIAPSGAVATGGQRTINIPIAPAQSKGLVQTGTGSQPRFIMPANAQVKIINANKLTPGTTLLSAGGNLLQSYAVIPAHLLNQQTVTSQAQPVSVSSTSQSSTASSQATPQPQPVKHSNSNGMLAADPSGNRPRKPCNCTKSQCLKLYCDCFANGEFCRNCNCHNCQNNLEHEDERAKAVKSCLDRNPMAFHPKIGKGQNGQQHRRHNKGCNCKRSGCLKNYCECYEAKILCTAYCKCVGCKNFEESPERKTLMHLADAAEVRVQQQTAARTKLSTQLQDYPTKTKEFSDSGERLPFSFITKEVAEATLQCLMAQADESERSSHPASYAEGLILEEFGRCILQVIHSAGKTKGANPE